MIGRCALLSLLLVSGFAFGCAPVEEPPDPAEIEAAALASFERSLASAIARVEAAASRADRTLNPLPLITPGAEASLRAYLNASHLVRAQALGVRVSDEAALDGYLEEGRLIALPDSTEHWIVRPRTSPAHVVPDVQVLLTELGVRFQERLAAMELPAYRIEVTSALRTSERQAALRRSNPNAAAGLSSHEFGTTVDVSYAAFAPPAELALGMLDGVPDPLVPHLKRVAELALESVSARKSRELTAIFAEVLREAQDEGIVLVIYERQQSVFHLTVGRALVGE